ncbi:MAG: hypothetical protein ACXWRE_04155 [Pseudobdellovibrionaceae bacterium]
MKSILFISLMVSLSLPAVAIQYVKGTAKISADEFNACSNKMFRKVAQDELSPENRRLAVKDVLVGKTINELDALKKYLSEHPDACSYGSDSEKF